MMVGMEQRTMRQGLNERFITVSSRKISGNSQRMTSTGDASLLQLALACFLFRLATLSHGFPVFPSGSSPSKVKYEWNRQRITISSFADISSSAFIEVECDDSGASPQQQSAMPTDSQNLTAQQQQQPIKPKGPKIHPIRQRPRLPILRYESNWVCINKPAGMTVHRSHKQSKFELVVTTTLKRQLRRKVWPVHRLDHRTSGALLFAFDAETCAALHASLRHADKNYIALVRGNWHDRFDTTTATITRPINVDGISKNATTIFRCLGVHEGNGTQPDDDLPCSLVSAHLVSGRHHQIRRHAYHMGMPVLGDTQHGDSRVNRWWRHRRGLDRLALHCLRIQHLRLDDNNDDFDIVAPLPQDLRHVLQHEALADLWQHACQAESALDTPFIDILSGTLGIKKEWQKQMEKQQENSVTAEP